MIANLSIDISEKRTENLKSDPTFTFIQNIFQISSIIFGIMSRFKWDELEKNQKRNETRIQIKGFRTVIPYVMRCNCQQ